MSAPALPSLADLPDPAPLDVRPLRATVARGLSVAGPALAVFVALLLGVLHRPSGLLLDRPLLTLLAAHRPPAAVPVARAVTFLGSSGFVAAVTVVLAVLWWRRDRHASVLLLAAVGGSAALTAFVKLAVGRPRPAVPLAVDTAERTLSFPSGHTLSSLALYGALAFLVLHGPWPPLRRGAVAAALGATALLVAVSRLYLGYHWPSDVLASWSLGAAWLAVVFTASTAWSLTSTRRAVGGQLPARTPLPLR